MGIGEPTKILFGTDGWRAKIGDEYTFENVRRLAEGVARVVEEDGATAKSVVIAYDRRFGVGERTANQLWPTGARDMRLDALQ